MNKRTINDLKEKYGTGVRVACRIPGFEKRVGVLVLRDLHSSGGLVLWDDMEQSIHHNQGDFREEEVFVEDCRLSSKARRAALDCPDIVSVSGEEKLSEIKKVDVFDRID
jgi:hypothetical protein